MPRRRRRRNGGSSKAAVIAIGGISIILLAHIWIFVFLLITGAAGGIGFLALRHHARARQAPAPRAARAPRAAYGPRAVRQAPGTPGAGQVTYHAEMTPAEKSATRKAQRPRVIDLGPNATAADRRRYQRDSPVAPANPPAPDDDIPPF